MKLGNEFNKHCETFGSYMLTRNIVLGIKFWMFSVLRVHRMYVDRSLCTFDPVSQILIQKSLTNEANYIFCFWSSTADKQQNCKFACLWLPTTQTLDHEKSYTVDRFVDHTSSLMLDPPCTKSSVGPKHT